MDLEQMRANYSQAELDERSVLSSPTAQFNDWLTQAEASKPGDWFEVNAMTLSTASSTGNVTARIVLLKRVDEAGAFFYTNQASQKGAQLANNPHCALVLYWPHLERQVRIEGSVAKTSEEDAKRYFSTRPRGSQIGAAASSQSQRVVDRKFLEDKFSSIDQQFKDQPIPKPADWGGYCVTPTKFEFWQGRNNRLHDRIVYEKDESSQWDIYRLAP